jgi:hypothetical protein
MRKERAPETRKKIDGEMRREYKFDYRNARPNRFASIAKDEPLVVLVDPDVAEVFTTPESVDRALRALIIALPKRGTSKELSGR